MYKCQSMPLSTPVIVQVPEHASQYASHCTSARAYLSVRQSLYKCVQCCESLKTAVGNLTVENIKTYLLVG